MKSFRTVIALVAAVLIAGAAAAQSNGNGRIQGKVVDEAGQPLENVQIRAQMVDQPDIRSTKTNKKGEWRLNGLADGQWKIEFAKEGLDPHRQMFEVRDEKADPLNITLAKPKPKEDPSVAINAELQKAVATAQAGKFAEARQICADIVAKNPIVTQCHAFIAKMYALEKNPAEAAKAARAAVAAEPANIDNKLLLADLLAEAGEKAESRQILDAVDMTTVKDPTAFINMAISLINEQKGADAAVVLTKLQAQFPTMPEILYYRGRAYLNASKVDEAKADLEKFVETGKADSPEMADAKKILEQLKKK